MNINQIAFFVSALCVIAACQSDTSLNSSSKSAQSVTKVVNCSAPPPLKDIWDLQPLLTKQGKITEKMTQEEREVVIREYIQKKNARYENCMKGKSI